MAWNECLFFSNVFYKMSQICKNSLPFTEIFEAFAIEKFDLILFNFESESTREKFALDAFEYASAFDSLIPEFKVSKVVSFI